MVHLVTDARRRESLAQKAPSAPPLPRHSPAQVQAHGLNLPGSDGREAPGAVKSDDNLKSISVIVLTTSSDKRDVER